VPGRINLSIDLQSIALRPAESSDEVFLFDLYASSRGDDLAAMGWDAAQIRDFLKTQYAAQQRFFQANYPEADEWMVLLESQAIGRLVVHRTQQEIRVVDIALLPEYRNTGIGTRLLRELLAEAERLRKPFRIQVMRSSAAVTLCERLGLTKTGETGSHYQMEWRADA
jgi:GNAT superfamily N-acetyltransferase